MRLLLTILLLTLPIFGCSSTEYKPKTLYYVKTDSGLYSDTRVFILKSNADKVANNICLNTFPCTSFVIEKNVILTVYKGPKPDVVRTPEGYAIEDIYVSWETGL